MESTYCGWFLRVLTLIDYERAGQTKAAAALEAVCRPIGREGSVFESVFTQNRRHWEVDLISSRHLSGTQDGIAIRCTAYK